MNNNTSKYIHKLVELKLAYHREKYPDLPEYARIKPKYKYHKANDLTNCIIDFIIYSGGQAERISNMGRYIDNTEVVTNVIGISKRIGSGKYIPGSGTKGTADISATIKGRSVKIEVKIGNDRQSDEQKKYQADVERAEGIYFIAKTFDEFYEWYIATW